MTPYCRAVRIADSNWMDVERYLERDDRVALPIGSTEQHAYVSLATDTILAERVAQEAAAPLGVLVLPALPYGFTPSFVSYPGMVSVTADTYGRVLVEATDVLRGQGFRRILLVNGHGGNAVVRDRVERDGVRWHDWFDSVEITALVDAAGGGGHASWTQNFPWTRLRGVAVPDVEKPRVTVSRELSSEAIRAELSDGSFGGPYARPDDEMLKIWEIAVSETRRILESDW